MDKNDRLVELMLSNNEEDSRLAVNMAVKQWGFDKVLEILRYELTRFVAIVCDSVVRKILTVESERNKFLIRVRQSDGSSVAMFGLRIDEILHKQTKLTEMHMCSNGEYVNTNGYYIHSIMFSSDLCGIFYLKTMESDELRLMIENYTLRMVLDYIGDEGEYENEVS